jgi:hypothetical protein
MAGRPKGSTNQKSIELKTMINNALHKAGGEDYLVRQAKENPVAFMTLIGKTLPLALKPDGAGKFSITWES